MSFDASQALRYSMDQGLAIPSIMGVAPYSATVITVTNDTIGFGDTDVSKVVSSKRLLIADGYRNYSALDGYLNPMLEQADGQNIVVSNAQITSNELMLGPLVFPYNLNGLSSGIDPTLFQPATGTNTNTTIYVQIQGIGLAPNGNYFRVTELVIDNMSGLSYSVKLTAIGAIPDLI